MGADRKRSDITVDGVFDIETEDWSTYVVGALKLASGECFVIPHERELELVERMLAVKGVLWAHNGGCYDVLWFLSHVAELGLKVQAYMAGQRLVCVKVGELELRDSWGVVPLKLVTGAGIGGAYKESTGLSCVCGRRGGCGGYCAIRRDMSRSSFRKLCDYLVADCDATLAMLRGLKEYADEHDLDLAGTIGASAWKTASRWLDIPPSDWGTSSIYRFARDGYYGGRVQVFQPHAEKGHRYDINSSYPAALVRTHLPCGEQSFLSGKAARDAFERCQEGIYEADVDVDRNVFIPPLPVRGKNRVGYPSGCFRGTWTRIELAYALGQGARLRGIGKALVWSDSRQELRFFSQRLWDLRAKEIENARQTERYKDNPKKAPLCEWLKLYANSLTGKLAQRPESESVVINPEDDPSLCKQAGTCAGFESFICGKQGCCPHRCSGGCGNGWSILDIQGAHRIWTRDIYRIPQCAYVHWAAYLTASARIALHEQLVDDGCGGDTAIYCDTDSCYSTEPRTKNIGGELGQWAYEGRLEEWEALAPKVYRYWDPKKEKAIVKAKGIPEAADYWEDIRQGRDISINRGVLSFKTAARRDSLFTRVATSRKITSNVDRFGDRRFQDARTYPMVAEEFLALE